MHFQGAIVSTVEVLVQSPCMDGASFVVSLMVVELLSCACACACSCCLFWDGTRYGLGVHLLAGTAWTYLSPEGVLRVRSMAW